MILKLCNNLMTKIAAFVLICGVVLLAGAPPVSAANVNIPDAGIRALINRELRKSLQQPNRALDAAVTEAEMETLTSLTSLTLSHSGDLTGLEKAPNLTTLRFTSAPDNRAVLPKGLSGLTQLTTLNLRYSRLANISALRGLTNLTTLDLDYNDISDISALSGMTKLTRLDLSANTGNGYYHTGDRRVCQGTGEWSGNTPSVGPGITDISALSGMTKLTWLSLEGHSITDISALSGMTKLTHLYLGFTAPLEVDLSPGTTFGQIATYSGASNTSTNYYSSKSKLELEGQFVDCGPLGDPIAHNYITDISVLSGLTELTRLDLSGNPLSYPSLYTHIPALKARGVTVAFSNRVPSTLTKVSGDAQNGVTGTALANPFVVEVKDSTTRSYKRYGTQGEEARLAEGDAESLFAGVPVTFTATAGGGTLSATSVATDATGRAQVTLTPGATAATQTVTATVTHAGKTLTQTFTAVSNNRPPTFTSAATFSVAENTTAVGTVVSTDADTQDRVTGYTLSGTDSAKFAITNAGVLTFIAAPDYDAPGDLVSTEPANAAGNNEYVIVVTATSGTGARIQTATQPLTITVTNVNELPGKPAAPTVTAVTATPTSLNVSWTAPTNPGPAITAYNLQYRKNNEVNWTAATYADTETSTTLTGLTSGTTYDVQVMAKNNDGDGPWSNSGSATTAANVVPTFTSANTFSVAENATAVGTVVATDEDSTDSITGYEITGGADSAKFAITNAGVLTFTAAPDYDAPGDVLSATPANAAGNNEYVIVVTATSGVAPRTQTATQVLTITVTNVNEPPAKPAVPTVTAVAATPTRLDVSWTAPGNTGPAITDYDVQYRAGTTGAFTDANYDGTPTSTTLTGLTVGTTYDVQVRARNTEGIGPWSDSGSAATATDAAPTFTSSATFSVVENTTAVGTVIATDANSGDSVTGYEITGGADSAKFAITNAGVLTFIAAPNYDKPGDLVSTTPVNAAGNNEYVIVVTATSGSGARELTATQSLTITVTDVNEPPGKPAAPIVTAAAATPTQLSVNWSEPTNTGPAINDYDVRYLADVTSTGDFIDAHYDDTATSTTLTGLKASTSYQVQVRAISPEGKGPWSDAGTAKTAVQPEDIDSDGDVDMDDLVSVVNNFGSTTPGRNDVDEDDDVDKDDIHAVFNAMLAAEAAGAPAHITRTAQTLHHYVQQAKQDAMLDANVYRGLAVLEELIEPFLMPDETALLRNYPNPFNPETWFPYQLSRAADVTIAIYSVNGMLVRTLSLGHQAAGMYRSKSRAAYWDGRNAFGEPVASGIYFYTLTAGDFSATGKMLIRK